jgi:hypothetical protein
LKGLTAFLQYIIALLIDNIQVASCVSTLLDSALRKGCFTSSRLVWDLGIILNFSLVQLVDRRVVMALLEDKQSLVREDCNIPIFGFSDFAIGDEFFGLCKPDQKVNLMLPLSSDGFQETYVAQPGPFIIFHHWDHSYVDNF